ECGPGGVVVDDEDGAAAADDPAEFGEAGFAAGAEEVRPPCVGDVDGGVRKRQRLRGADTDGDAGQAAGPAGGRRREAGVRFHADDALGLLGEEGEVVAGAAADVEDVRALPRADGAHGVGEHAVGVGGAILQFVEVGGVPDVGARYGAPGDVGHGDRG